MLLGLSIRDVVLIERLDMAFQPGLSALTGETGAGKSILLDSMGLALGARSDASLVRKGAKQLSVTAEFALPALHPALALLDEQGVENDETLILRRTVSIDGRSRAFVNDQPVSAGFLKKLGDRLVEINGQFASHSLLNPATHQDMLDAFGKIDATLVRNAWAEWRKALSARNEAEQRLAKAQSEEDYLRHAVGELAKMAPVPGEESVLAERRQTMIHGEKLIEAITQANSFFSRHGDADAQILSAARALERVADKAQGLFDSVIEALNRAALETSEAGAQLARLSQSVDLDPKALESVEERLFALRALARKHNVAVDDLAALQSRMEADLDALESGNDNLGRLAEAERKAGEKYQQTARKLSAERNKAASALEAAVAKELPALKLDRARFMVRIIPLGPPEWNSNGVDSVSFEVATNAGTDPGPLAKIASGGELARLMLALKVVLAGMDQTDVIVFDEADSAVGGAVAAAVGERLSNLATKMQVLAVTHSPQVAALADHHWHVAKEDDGKGGTVTKIAALSPDDRKEEIARMLSGAEITVEARAAAEQLLLQGGAMPSFEEKRQNPNS